MGCLENENNGSAILWQIEHNGSWNWEVSYTCNSLYLKLSGPSEQKNHWWLDLKSSMKFKTVPAAISFGANGFDSAVCEMTKYRRKIVNRKMQTQQQKRCFRLLIERQKRMRIFCY